jgi:hypothetical protein
MSILYRDDPEIDLDQLTVLFDAVGWERRAAQRERLAQFVRGSMHAISAGEGDRLVGSARAISDGAANACISTVAALPEYQKRGIGHDIIRRLVEDRDHLQFMLHANERAYPFSLHLGAGFELFDNVLVRRRKY